MVIGNYILVSSFNIRNCLTALALPILQLHVANRWQEGIDILWSTGLFNRFSSKEGVVDGNVKWKCMQ